MHTVATLLPRVFLPFAAGYFLSFLYRAVNAVIAPELLHDLSLDPGSLGLLTATYFIAFASFQLPLGVLLDRYGPRRVEALLLLFAAAGAFCFARAHSLPLLIAGRALIGFGVSACLMAAFKAYTQWFVRERWPLVNGFQMAAGGLGALAAASPVQALLAWTDWRGIFLGLALVTLAVAALLFLVVPDKAADAPTEPFSTQLQGIRQVFTSPRFWRIAPLTAVSQAAFFAIQGLWAAPWLKDAAGLDRTATAQTLSLIAVAMVAGFICLGALAARLQHIGFPAVHSAAAGMVLFLFVQTAIVLAPPAWTLSLWLGFGFFGTAGTIAYASLSQEFPVHLAGRVSTALNLLVFIASFVAQWAIGLIVGLWPQTAAGGLSPVGLRAGFLLMIVCQAIGLLWFILAGRIGQTGSQENPDP